MDVQEKKREAAVASLPPSPLLQPGWQQLEREIVTVPTYVVAGAHGTLSTCIRLSHHFPKCLRSQKRNTSFLPRRELSHDQIGRLHRILFLTLPYLWIGTCRVFMAHIDYFDGRAYM